MRERERGSRRSGFLSRILRRGGVLPVPGCTTTGVVYTTICTVVIATAAAKTLLPRAVQEKERARERKINYNDEDSVKSHGIAFHFVPIY